MTEPPRQDNDDYDGHRFFRGIVIGAVVSLLLWGLMLWLILR